MLKMKQPTSAQTSRRAASVRTALLLAVVAAAVFGTTIVSQSLQVHP
jgi:hypothetical protein